MRLQLKNIGKLAEADVELKGITVIGGENDTGKSTVGKVLFSVFNGFYDVENRIARAREASIYHVLRKLDVNLLHSDVKAYIKRDYSLLVEKILENSEKYQADSASLESEIVDWFPDSSAETIAQTAKHISLQLSVPNQVLYSQVILNSLIGEFERQFCRQTTEDSSISLTIQNHTANIFLKEQAVRSIENPLYLNTETLYIDDPTVIENLRANNVYRHRAHLIQKLEEKMEQNTVDAVIYDEKMKHILEHVNRVCGGKILQEGRELLYQISDNSSPLSMKNVSTGIKMFAIIKRLIENGVLGFNSTLILDEPEIHVHPKWQLVFAEIIVLLQKEFDMHILLNTHSPYFLEAIEVYSKKHGIEEKCRYYLSENTEDGSVIRDVTDCTEEIYKKLADPFQTLEDVRYGG